MAERLSAMMGEIKELARQTFDAISHRSTEVNQSAHALKEMAEKLKELVGTVRM